MSYEVSKFNRTLGDYLRIYQDPLSPVTPSWRKKLG